MNVIGYQITAGWGLIKCQQTADLMANTQLILCQQTADLMSTNSWKLTFNQQAIKLTWMENNLNV